MPEMPNKRGSHMSAVLGNNVYVMGGWDSENYLDHVEVYDTRAGRWRSAPPMATPRAYGSSAVMDDKIYMIGGLSDAVSRPPLMQRACLSASTALWCSVLLSQRRRPPRDLLQLLRGLRWPFQGCALVASASS